MKIMTTIMHFRRKKKCHKWPKLKTISAPKAENKRMAQLLYIAYKEFSE